MKKVIAVILCLVVFVCASGISAFAQDYYIFPSHTTVSVSIDSAFSSDSRGSNMIKNPYYQKYYNELLNYSCQIYEKMWQQTENADYIAYYAKSYMKNAENYVTVIFSAPGNTSKTVRDYNMDVLEKYIDTGAVIYVSDYDYAAVICLSAEEAHLVCEMAELVFVGAAFFTNYPFVMFPAFGTYTLGNVQPDSGDNEMGDTGRVTAGDARFLLRYVAGLEEVGAVKSFYFCADMDFDNDIDAADARLVLRTAAGMERKCFLSYSYFQYWTDYMGELK